MTTLPEKRHRETTDSMYRTLEQRDACIAKLCRTELKLDRLRRLLARQTKALAKVRTTPRPQPMAPPAAVYNAQHPLSPPVVEDDPIPSFLDRRNLMADPKTKDRNAERRVVEKEKRDAKLTGATKRMPLTGKAALAHILGS
jgi:hypothetical protein